MRKIYLDNIRFTTVMLVLIYHVCYLFNGVGVLGAIPDADNLAAFDVLTYVVYPWFMVLLFVIAGMSARYALQHRTEKQFLKERAVKLLAPSTLGLFVIHWITGYLNIKIGGGLSYIPAPLVYPVSVISGIGPLWFIQMLFLFSAILVMLRKFDKADRLWQICAKMNTIVILLLSLLIWGASMILNAPVLTMYRFGIYFAAFMIGYYIFSHEEILCRIEKIRIPALIISIVCAAAYTMYYYGSDYTSPVCLQSIFTNIYLWVVILAIIGNARKYFNHENGLTRYLSKNSFGIYILHYPVLMVTCYVLCYHTSLPALAKYLIALVIGFAVTFILNEVIKRIPVIRFLVLGLKRNRQSP